MLYSIQPDIFENILTFLFVLNVDVDRSFSILAQKDTDQRAKVAQSIIKFNCLTGVKWFRGDREQRCLCL